MKVAVWDTLVLREDNKVMHFDIFVPESVIDEKIILNYGKTYIKTKPFKTKELTLDECTFCHVEEINPTIREQIFNSVKLNGYAIVELENCD